MKKFRVVKGGARLVLPERNLVLSKKAQLFLLSQNPEAVGYLNKMAELREEYMYARDFESINRITAFEIEQTIRNGLTLALRRSVQREKRA